MIKQKIKELIKIVAELKAKYPYKEFTLDGRLVGDLGEIIVEENYKIKLYEKVINKYDGFRLSDKKPVQIKTTMKNSVWYPRDYHPELFLAIELNGNGEFIELTCSESRKKNPNYTYYVVTKGKLIELNKKVDPRSRIKRR
jgi:hypothetical protein